MRALCLLCSLLLTVPVAAQIGGDRVTEEEVPATDGGPVETESDSEVDDEPPESAEAEGEAADESAAIEPETPSALTPVDPAAPAEPVDAEPVNAEPVNAEPESSTPRTEPRPEDPATATADADDDLVQLRLKGCRDRFARGDLGGARVCYEGSAGADRRTVARHVAGTLARVEGLRAERGPNAGERISEYVLGGKAELVATSGAYGAYLGAVTDFAVLGLMQSAQLTFPSGGLGALVLGSGVLVPVVTGGLTLAGAGVGTWLLEDMTAGQANLVRAGMWLATFDASLVPFITSFHLGNLAPGFLFRNSFLLTSGTILGVNAVVMGSAITAATLLPEHLLPPNAGSLALSAATYGGALTLLGMAMNRFEMDDIDELTLFTLVPNLGFLTGLALAPFVPLTRYETWLMDGGAVVGTLLGAAVVIGLPAGNPVAGYGGIGVGMVLGAGTAVAVGKLVPLGLDLVPLPDLVAVAPMVLPPTPTTPPALGFQVEVDLGRLLVR